jgi:hypothetical protein
MIPLKHALLRVYESAMEWRRTSSIYYPFVDTLREYLFDKPNQYLDEMVPVLYLWNELEVSVFTFAVSRALKSIGWFKKTCRRVAKSRNADLQNYYMYQLSPFRSY